MTEFPVYKTRPIAELIPYARNSRTHSDEQVAQIAASIKEFGFLNPIITDGENGIVAGHGRVLAAQKIGLDRLPCVEASHLTAAQKRAYIIADNKLALNAGWDDEMLRVEFADLADEGFDLELTGFSLDEIDALTVGVIEEGQTDEDAVPDAPEAPVTVEGDVWVLGNHRLMCGDSSNPENIDAIFGSGVDLLLTDPPYGIGYGGSMKLGQEKFGWKQHKGGWDEVKPDSGHLSYAIEKAVEAIVWGGNYFTDILPPTMGWLLWDKGQRGFSLADGEMAWTSFNNAMRILSLSRATANREEKIHATQKPIALLEWCLDYADRHSKKRPETIGDCFGGSGSTLIMAEKRGRSCHTIEIDPTFCDASIKRWQDYTGKQATHAESGQTFEEVSHGRYEAPNEATA